MELKKYIILALPLFLGPTLSMTKSKITKEKSQTHLIINESREHIQIIGNTGKVPLIRASKTFCTTSVWCFLMSSASVVLYVFS